MDEFSRKYYRVSPPLQNILYEKYDIPLGTLRCPQGVYSGDAMKFSIGVGDLYRSRKYSFRLELEIEASAERVRRLIVALTPSKSGATRASWEVRRVNSRRYEAFSNYRVARWLEEGTGRYGPRHSDIPIKAKAGSVLRWEGDASANAPLLFTRFRGAGLKSRPERNTGEVFARRALVKGIKPREYGKIATETLMPDILERIRIAAIRDLEEQLNLRG